MRLSIPKIVFPWMIIIGVCNGPAFGDEPAIPPQTVLVEIALQNNPGLLSQREKIAAKSMTPAPAGALPDPMVELELMNFEVPRFKPWDAFGSGISLAYTQVIPNAAKRRAAREEALREVDMEKARLTAMESELRSQVLTAAYRLATIRKLLEVKEQVQQALKASAQVATAAYSVGRGNQTDVLLAQAEITRIDIEKEELLRQQDITVAQLESLLGISAREDVLAAIQLSEPAPLPPLNGLLKELEDHAPKVLMAKAGEITQAGRVEVAKKSFKPDLMAGAGARIRDMSMGGASFLTFKIGVTLPSFHHRDRYIPALEESLRLQESARQETRQAVVSSRYKLTGAYATASRSLSTFDLYKNGLLLQARLAYESTLAAYSAQKADFNALTQALTNFYNYQSNLIMTQGDFQESVAMMEAILGHPMINPPLGASSISPNTDSGPDRQAAGNPLAKAKESNR